MMQPEAGADLSRGEQCFGRAIFVFKVTVSARQGELSGGGGGDVGSPRGRQRIFGREERALDSAGASRGPEQQRSSRPNICRPVHLYDGSRGPERLARAHCGRRQQTGDFWPLCPSRRSDPASARRVLLAAGGWLRS